MTGKLGTPDSLLGNIQLGGSSVDVIYEASDTLVFTQLAETTIVRGQTASNVLTLTQSVTASLGVLNQFINQPLTFLQTVRGFSGTKILGQPISFSQIAGVVKIYNRLVTDTITFLQAASVDRIRPASNTIVFVDSASALSYKGANDTLVFTQTVTMQYNPHIERLTQILDITHSATVSRVTTQIASDAITFTQNLTGGRVKSLNATNAIFFHDSAVSTKIGIINQPLNLTQTATQFRIISRSASNTIGFQHTLNRQVTYNLSASNTLVFTNTHLKNGISVPNVIVTIPTNQVIYQVPGQAVTFKPPLFGDTEAGKGKLIEERTSTGQLFTYVRRSLSRKLVYKFDISLAKAEEFRKYIRANLSNPMYLTNWKGEIWYGNIVNNPFVITSKGRSDPYDLESNEIEVQFEGTRIH